MRIACRAVAARLATRQRLPMPEGVGLFVGPHRLAPDRETQLADAIIAERTSIESGDPLGSFYQATLSWRLHEEPAPRIVGGSNDRRARGAFYTPPSLVGYVLDRALDGGARPDVNVCDPACGSGAFLVAAAERLSRRPGADRVACFRRVFGVDLDPMAADIARTRLWLQLDDPATPLGVFDETIRTGDALLGAVGDEHEPAIARIDTPDGLRWATSFPKVLSASGSGRGFDAIVGNPPFLNQLSSKTAASRPEAALLRALSDGAVTGYADLAVAFLMRSSQLLRPRGQLALVLPESVLATRDAASVRDRLARDGALTSLWIERPGARDPSLFDAGVRTCVLGYTRQGDPSAPVRRFAGAAFREAPSARPAPAELADGRAWSFLAAPLRGVPSVRIRSAQTLGDLADITADFRDEFYALRGSIIDRLEADDHAFPKLVTVGLIDPAHLLWGQRPARLHKQTWAAPRLDRARFERDPRAAAWLARRLTPKLLVATQTRTIEVVVDSEGALAPVTPALVVSPKPGVDPWALAAMMGSPALSALAAERYAGAALSSDAIKLSARQLADLPACPDSDHLSHAGEAFRAASHARHDDERDDALRRAGRHTLSSFGVEDGPREIAFEWWWARQPIRPTKARTKAPLTAPPRDLIPYHPTR